MLVQQGYVAIVERFQQGLWDTKQFTQTDESSTSMIVGTWVLSFHHFTPCIIMWLVNSSAPPGNKLIKKRRNHIIVLAKESTVHVCLIVLYLFFEPSLTFGLLEQEQWKPTTEIAIKLTRRHMMMITAHQTQRKKNRGLQNRMRRMNNKINGMIICLSPVTSGEMDLPDYE